MSFLEVNIFALFVKNNCPNKRLILNNKIECIIYLYFIVQYIINNYIFYLSMHYCNNNFTNKFKTIVILDIE